MQKWILAGKISAFLAPLVFLVLATIAIVNFSGYNPTVNFLSDLGVHQGSALFFNSGLILAGLIAVVLAFSLYKIFDIKYCKIGAFFLAIGNASLMLVGIFTENMTPWHGIFAALFFICIALTLISFGWGLRKINHMSYFSVMMGLFVPFFFAMGITPFSEHMAVSAAALWSFGVSIFLKDYKHK